MTRDELARVETLESLVTAHTALFASIMGVLKARNGLTPDEINTVFDLALMGVENLTDTSDGVTRGARRFLEDLAKTPKT